MAINERQVALRKGGNFTTLDAFLDKREFYKKSLVGTFTLAAPATSTIGETVGALASGGSHFNDGDTAVPAGFPNAIIAIQVAGAVATTGYVVDDFGNAINLVEIVDSTSLDPILVNGRKVFGLVQISSTATLGTEAGLIGDSDKWIAFVSFTDMSTLSLVTLPAGTYAHNLVTMVTGRNNKAKQLMGGAHSQTDVIQASSVEPLVHTLTVTASIAATTALGINTGNAHANTTVGGADSATNISLGVDAAAFNGDDDLMVFLNGVKLIKNSEVTWASAVTLTLSIALDADDVLEIVVPV